MLAPGLFALSFTAAEFLQWIALGTFTTATLAIGLPAMARALTR
jgi:hypothetical protein